MAKHSLAAAPKGARRSRKEPPHASLIGFDPRAIALFAPTLENVHRLLVQMQCGVLAKELGELLWAPHKQDRVHLGRIQKLLMRLCSRSFPGCQPDDVSRLQETATRARHMSVEVFKSYKDRETDEFRTAKASAFAAKHATGFRRFPPSDNSATAGVAPPEPSHVSASGRVKLFGLAGRPVIDGVEVDRLTPQQYSLVVLLIEGRGVGIPIKKLESQYTGARATFRRLKKLEAWSGVLHSAKTANRGYRID